MTGIYKITSPSGKIYIGSTVDFERRMNQYRWKSTKEQVRLHRSFNKYGFENHITELIEECEELQLNIKERYWQEYYNVCGESGLNCLYVETDVKPRKLSEDTIQKMKKAMSGEGNPRYGVKLSDETKNKIREKALGRSCSEENKIAQSKMMIGNNLSPLKKEVVDTETGEIFDSINKAAIANNIVYETLKGYLSGRTKNKTNLILL